MKELIEIQSKLKAPKNQYNSFGKYKYRSQEDILEALKPLLKEHNCTLVITDEVKEVGEFIYIEATACITNEKGYIKEVKAQAGINPNKKGMDISQSFGSSSSYARKYALNGLFLIDDTKDADTMNNSNEGKKKPLTDEQFQKAKIADATKIKNLLNSKVYTLTSEQRAELTTILTNKK